MGEAKNRGTFEERKTQARRKLLRGIITYPGNDGTKGSSFRLDTDQYKKDMYYYAMYWDRILIPTGMVQMRLPVDDDFISHGVLEKVMTSDYETHPSCLTPDGKHIDLIQHDLWVTGEIAKQKLNSHGEIWDINHITDTPIYFKEHAREANTIRMRLTKALPYPIVDNNTSIERLLKFKEHRGSELIALQDSMDNLLKRIYEEPMHALKENEILRFENAVNELNRTLRERFTIVDKNDWELNLSLDTSLIEKASTIGMAIAADSTASPLSFPFFTTATSALSLFSLSKTYGLTFNRYARKDIKLEYISRAKAKKIIP
ncbi:DUF6236 family protein [Acinetobacter baumannii]|nr:DUF6236 family protein [Acinetobacter baumannii]